MEDMPLIFSKVDIDATVKPGYDIYLMDDVPAEPPQGLVIHFKSKMTLSLWYVYLTNLVFADT